MLPAVLVIINVRNVSPRNYSTSVFTKPPDKLFKSNRKCVVVLINIIQALKSNLLIEASAYSYRTILYSIS